LYGCRSTPDRYVFSVMTIVNSPAIVITVSYWCLVACTAHVVQPNVSESSSIRISDYHSCVTETHKSPSTDRIVYAMVMHIRAIASAADSSTSEELTDLSEFCCTV